MTEFIDLIKKENVVKEPKKTIFYKRINFTDNKFSETKFSPENWNVVEYIGHDGEIDIFRCYNYTLKNNVYFYTGKKGDEFE